ncbi:class I SAM-dependent methyltransferase [Thermospira aquatica]|uniref:Class I SAM-dependent methyltransferase n=1 Tax=Thermospira aquatica TaxID=2828656 RepID=A0AAX3BEA0_9SPIR|nr:class I SAM-dependent methyltransferase [Thermospira aquatica]URA10473.1 class I SAM-dependent methyltransferase [Thermospira aquatica]
MEKTSGLFYEILAKWYDEIFPLSEELKGFVTHWLRDNTTVLDIGSATGELASFLGSKEEVSRVVALDLDPAMVLQAREKTRNNPKIEVKQMDMMAIGDLGEAFHLITCLGNTLVHLDSYESIQKFCRLCYGALKPQGRLIIQILHYDTLVHRKVESLPLIESEHCIFERFYAYHGKRVEFRGCLLDKSLQKSYESRLWLYPLEKDELLFCFDGLDVRIDLYGDFSFTPLFADSPLLVAVVERV